MSVKNYTKISKEYLPFFGLADVYFDDEIIGKIKIVNDLELTINETWQDYTTDSAGGNTIESKLTAINVSSSIELALNKENQSNFISIVESGVEGDKVVSSISLNSLGNSSKKGELKIVPFYDNQNGDKNIIVYNCILKTNQTIGLGVSNDKKITINFIALPTLVNGELRLIKLGQTDV